MEMDCAAATERLPWLLNGTLDEPEAKQVRAHLAACPACRAEMDETRRAAAVFAAHLPTAVLVDLAWDRVPPGLDPELARGHLDACDDCRQELELARESRRAESSEPQAAARRRPVWPLVTLPATLAAGLVLGLSWPSRRETAAPPAGAEPQRLATLQAEVTRLRGLVAALEGAARSPRLNLPVFELLPGALVRGGEAEANTVAIPAGAGEVALLLTTEAPPGTSATLVIRRGRDEVWRGQGLLPRPPGGYVVVVPADLLPEGSYELEVQPQRGPRAVYAVRVRHAR